MKRFNFVAIIVTVCLIAGLIAGFTTVSASEDPIRYFSLRTDSLTATSDGVSIVESNGVSVAEASGIGGGSTGLVIGTGDYVTFEFDLADDCVGGTIKVVGYEMGYNSPAANVGIYIPGYAENDGYYVLDPINMGDGTLSIVGFGFGNTSWYDSAKKIIRVRIFGATDERPAKILQISVSDEIPDVVQKKINLDVLSDYTGKITYIGGGVNIYYDNGVTPFYHLVGPVICEFFVPAETESLIPSLIQINDGAVVLRNAGGIDGTPGNYTYKVENGKEIPLDGFTVENSGGVSFKRVVLMMYGGENHFVKTLSFEINSGSGGEQTTGFEAIVNVNSDNVPESGYSYFKVGSAEEKKHCVSTSETDFEETNSGMVNDTNLGGSFTYQNARKVKAGEYVMYEFDLPDTATGATLKIFVSGSRPEVAVHSDESRNRFALRAQNSFAPGSASPLIYSFDDSDALTESDKVIRVLLTAESDFSLFSVMIQTSDPEPLAESVMVQNLSEESLRYLVDANSVNMYYLLGTAPSFFLSDGNELIYKFAVDGDEVVLNVTGSGLIGYSYSFDGVNYSDVSMLNNAAAGVCETKILKIDCRDKDELYVKFTGSGFLRSFGLGIEEAVAVNYDIDTFTAYESGFIYDMSMADYRNPALKGYVGIAHGMISENGRRIAFKDAVDKAYITYKFVFDASKIKDTDGVNALNISMKVVRGTYEVSVSSNPGFPESSTLRFTGSSSTPSFDASDILTATETVNGTKTVYVRVSHNNAVADTEPYGGNMDLVFEQISAHADGTKGIQWPNDSNFDYDMEIDYEHAGELPAVPAAPEAIFGTENVGGGCSSGASAILFAAIFVGGILAWRIKL
ncbi:MAG: hypothetical protein ACI4S9_02595 [Christensenellales bacterium]